MNDCFELKIMRQFWLDDGQDDLCSHGEVMLRINDTVIVDDTDGEWSIIESALALMRTVLFEFPGEEILDFYLNRYQGVTDESFNLDLVYDSDALILHCGRFSAFCPCRVTYKVKHEGENVILSDFKKYRSTSQNEVVEYPNLTAKIPLQQYAKEIFDFALAARNFYQGVDKVVKEELYEGQYVDFWDEYELFLARVNGINNLYKWDEEL